MKLQQEKLITFAQACKEFPGNHSTGKLHRWRMKGIRGHKLESILIGGVRYTSIPALWRFCEAINADADAERPTLRVISESDKEALNRHADMVEQELAVRFGI